MSAPSYPETQDLAVASHDDYPTIERSLAARNTLVKPIATVEEIKSSFDAFQKLKVSLLDPKMDIQVYKDQKGNEVRRIKKSGCKKIATAFGLDVKTIKKEVTELPGGNIAVEYTVIAIAVTGRSAEGIGMCDTTEPLYASRKNHKLHDVFATAFTRASNRAILDLVGGGEVSAEEISTEEETAAANRKPVPQSWLDKLLSVVTEKKDGQAQLAKIIFEEVGFKYLSREEIIRVAEKLAKVENINPAPQQVIDPAATPAKAASPTAPAKKAPAPAHNQSAQTIDPAAQDRLHRASWIEAATQVVTVSPDGRFVGVNKEQFEQASMLIAGGRHLVELAEAAGVESFSSVARQRYSGQLKTQELVWSAALHTLAEWCELHPAQTTFPPAETEEEEIDLADMPF